jgi:hypothetical protein
VIVKLWVQPVAGRHCKPATSATTPTFSCMARFAGATAPIRTRP